MNNSIERGQDFITHEISENTTSEEIRELVDLPLKFRGKEELTYSKLEAQIGFDEKAKNLIQQLLLKYKDYPKIQAILLENIEDLSDSPMAGRPDFYFNELTQFEREDIFELIKLYEDRLSGNEGHIFSRVEELGKKFLQEIGSDYIDLLKKYIDAPITTELISRNIQGYWSGDITMEQRIGIMDEHYKTLGSIARAKILMPFYDNEDVRNKITEEYKEHFFYLNGLKSFILNNDRAKILNYSILGHFNNIEDNEFIQLLKQDETVEHVKEFVKESNSRHKYGWANNLLLDDAVQRDLITNEEKIQILSNLKSELAEIENKLTLRFEKIYSTQTSAFDNKFKLREFISDKKKEHHTRFRDQIFHLQKEYFEPST